MGEGLTLKYIIDLPMSIAKKVNNLILGGSYENLTQFAITAFQNQLLLEETSKESLDSLITTSISKEVTIEQPVAESSSMLSINFIPEQVRTVSPPENSKIPNDCLWGQYNRIFPIKITLRVLANLLKENETIDLSVLQSNAVQSAREIGLALKKEDKKNRRKYGEMLSSALPVGRNLSKTENRFINHFVGYYTRAGRIEGAPGALKLLNIFEENNGSYQVGITQNGLGFAALRNPILDEENYSLTLSQQESSFYIKNVLDNLKREEQLTVEILKAAKDGKSSPSDLNDAISHFSRGWSQAMINTIRAGAVSRLHELGLLGRLRRGIRVFYSLTEFGKETLDNFMKLEGEY
jgi:hypothetical protein